MAWVVPAQGVLTGQTCPPAETQEPARGSQRVTLRGAHVTVQLRVRQGSPLPSPLLRLLLLRGWVLLTSQWVLVMGWQQGSLGSAGRLLEAKQLGRQILGRRRWRAWLGWTVQRRASSETVRPTAWGWGCLRTLNLWRSPS